MSIDKNASATPEKPALVMSDTGERVTFAELNARSIRLARLFRERRIEAGSHIAVMMENNPRYHEVCWAAQRAGLHYTPINWHLTESEAAYILGDCDAEAFIVSHALAPLAASLLKHIPPARLRLMVGGTQGGFEDYEGAASRQSTQPLPDESDGSYMFYSSGTTGRPKGIKRLLDNSPFGTPTGLQILMRGLYGFDPDTVYLCPAPLYHAAPLAWSMAVQGLGGTAVVMPQFDALEALRTIETCRVTHAQFVPTMFIRMLRLSETERRRFDISSLKVAVHAAAPCPIEIKAQMIEWWGPIIFEYYSGSEGAGFTAISSKEWLQHKGSVGRPMTGAIHIVNERGEEVPAGETGLIYFEGAQKFEYHKDRKKTADVFNEMGWSTLGDIGHLDCDGYLYLTDRKSNMIISGGVNIYPQEAENVLASHPAIQDVAVIGIPNAEFGEEVKAVVELIDRSAASEQLAQEIIAHARERLAAYKCPRSVDFVDQLPRQPNGKLLKRELKTRCWGDRTYTTA